MDNTTNTHGGARKGAGRPKGSGNTVSAKALLEAIETTTGVPFEESVAQLWYQALHSDDKHLQHKWSNLIMSKVMSTQSRIEVEDYRDNIEEKQEAFRVALANMMALEERKKQAQSH